MTNYDDAFSTRPFTMRLIITQNSQNIGANTSVVGWRLRVIRTGNYASFSSSGNSHSVVVNGTTVSSGSWTYDFTGTSIGDYIDIAAGTRTITHNADGTKSIAVSASATGSSIGSASKSGTFALTTIPRASTPTFDVGGVVVTSINAGSAIDINTNRASSSFTHDISYIFGGQSGTIDTAVATETSWTPPVTLLTEIPNATSGAVQIITDTYNGATYIGTTYVILTLTAGAGAVPDFGTVTNTEATSSPNVASIVGAYVKGISTLAVAITSPVGYQGSTITNYKIEVLDPSSVVTQTINAISGTTAAISWSGTGKLRGTVTDSRGRTHSEDITLTVMSYANPTISPATTAYRANSGGTATPSGTYIRTDVTSAVQSLIVGTQKNNLKYRIRIKASSDATAWASVTPVVNNTGVGAVTYVGSSTYGTYSVANSYKVRVEIEDNLGVISAQEFTVGTGGALIHMSKTADGIGVGKYWQQGSVDAQLRMYQQAGQKVIDESDLATTTVVGVMKKADNTIAVAGTATDAAVTPAGVTAVVAAWTSYRFGGTLKFTSSGTFSKATWTGLKAVRVRATGGGGAGSGSNNGGGTGPSKGAGGGAGATAEAFTLASSLGSSVTVTVGAGGVGAVGAQTTGAADGGSSSFGSFAVAGGGGGGLGTGANGTVGFGVVGGDGGTATAGDILIAGGDGIYAMQGSLLGASGAGGASVYGSGGRGQAGASSSGATPGIAGRAYGSGGGGAITMASGTTQIGGSGAPGIVLVDLYY